MLQAWSLSVCLSVRLSVPTLVDCDHIVVIFIHHNNGSSNKKEYRMCNKKCKWAHDRICRCLGNLLYAEVYPDRSIVVPNPIRVGYMEKCGVFACCVILAPAAALLFIQFCWCCVQLVNYRAHVWRTTMSSSSRLVSQHFSIAKCVFVDELSYKPLYRWIGEQLVLPATVCSNNI